jgi:hypothetical protein
MGKTSRLYLDFAAADKIRSQASARRFFGRDRFAVADSRRRPRGARLDALLAATPHRRYAIICSLRSPRRSER